MSEDGLIRAGSLGLLERVAATSVGGPGLGYVAPCAPGARLRASRKRSFSPVKQQAHVFSV